MNKLMRRTPNAWTNEEDLFIKEAIGRGDSCSDALQSFRSKFNSRTKMAVKTHFYMLKSGKGKEHMEVIGQRSVLGSAQVEIKNRLEKVRSSITELIDVL